MDIVAKLGRVVVELAMMAEVRELRVEIALVFRASKYAHDVGLDGRARF